MWDFTTSYELVDVSEERGRVTECPLLARISYDEYFLIFMPEMVLRSGGE